MGNLRITCPECKTTNKIPKSQKVFNCRKCNSTVFNDEKAKERFKFLKKISGVEKSNQTKSRDNNKEDIKKATQNLYISIGSDVTRKDFENAKKKLIQLFYIDNTYPDKYFLMLLIQLKVTSTVEAYDAFRKLSKKKRQLLLETNYIQNLHLHPQYRLFIDDLIRHAYHKKIRKNQRMKLQLG